MFFNPLLHTRVINCRCLWRFSSELFVALLDDFVNEIEKVDGVLNRFSIREQVRT